MEGGDPWPEGVKMHGGKMYIKDRLCVPTGLGLRVVGACHMYGGHMGVNRLVKALNHSYIVGKKNQNMVWHGKYKNNLMCAKPVNPQHGQIWVKLT